MISSMHPMQGVSSDTDQPDNIKNKDFYYNARSLLPKSEELCTIVGTENPDIVCIMETWLSDEIENDELAVGKYQVYRLDRNRHGGGVLIYVNSCFSVKVLLSVILS